MDLVGEVVVVVAEGNGVDRMVGGNTHNRIEVGAVDTLVDVGRGQQGTVAFHEVVDNADEEEGDVVHRNLDPWEPRGKEHEDAQADAGETDYKVAPTSSLRCSVFFPL
jgi:hypothetical protein